jgi:hypothetical protein
MSYWSDLSHYESAEAQSWMAHPLVPAPNQRAGQRRFRALAYGQILQSVLRQAAASELQTTPMTLR